MISQSESHLFPGSTGGKIKLGIEDASAFAFGIKPELESLVASLKDIHDALFMPAPWNAFLDSFRGMLDFIDCPSGEADSIMDTIKL